MSLPTTVQNAKKPARTINRSRLSTDRVAAELTGVTFPAHDNGTDFYLDHASVHIGPYLLRRVVLGAATMSIHPTPQSQQDVRFIYLARGSLTLTQSGRTIQLSAGEAAFAIGWQTVTLTSSEKCILAFVSIDRETIESRGIMYPHTVRKLGDQSLLPHASAAFFTEAFNPEYHPLTPRDTGRLVRVMDTFFVELHLTYIDSHRSAAGRRDEQRAAVLAFLSDYRETTALTVGSLAEHLGTTTRALYRLFQGHTPSLREALQRSDAR